MLRRGIQDATASALRPATEAVKIIDPPVMRIFGSAARAPKMQPLTLTPNNSSWAWLSLSSERSANDASTSKTPALPTIMSS
jgi:hypothetical protein